MRFTRDGIVVCKKNYEKFEANKMYKILGFNTENINIDGEIFSLKKEKRNMIVCHICPGQKSCYTPSFDEAFFVLKEARKKKLLKLKK